MLTAEIIGNIGNDAEIKEFNGKKYISFSVAHTDRYRSNTGATQETTTWVSVLKYGDGGNLIQYLKKGNKVFVRGALSVKTYQDKNGHTQIAVNVNANELSLCGSNSAPHNPAQPANPFASGQAPESQKMYNQDDDLPF